MTEDQNQVRVADMCKTHQALLVSQCNYGPKDSWQVLIIATQIALFQGSTVDPKTWKETEGKAENFSKLGCLACRKPDLFGTIVHEVNQTRRRHHIKRIKELGEEWLKKGQANARPSGE